ncbi:MAG: 2-oxoglutarate oxidoreductase, partial [Planctomycetota bacterium]
PMRMCELLEELDATRFLGRCTVTSARRVRETKRMLRKAFQYQINEVGFSFVEILSPCPTYWRLSPRDCGRHIEEVMAETFPLGIIKDAGDSKSDSD